MSPTVRKRTASVSTASPALRRRERRHRHQQAVAPHHLAPVREVEARQGQAARARCTARRRARSSWRSGTRACARRDARGRCRGPSTPGAGASGPTGRSCRGTRTRAPWRAPSPRRAGRRRSGRRSSSSSMASSSVTDCAALRESSSPRSRTVPRRIESSTERTISRSPSSAARAVAELDHLGEVVAGVDVQQREAGSAAAGTPSPPGAAARSCPCRRRTAAPARRTAPRPRAGCRSPPTRASRGDRSGRRCRGWRRARAARSSRRRPARPRSSAGAGRIPWPCRAPTTSGRRAGPRRADRPGAGLAADRRIAAGVQGVEGHVVARDVAADTSSSDQ